MGRYNKLFMSLAGVAAVSLNQFAGLSEPEATQIVNAGLMPLSSAAVFAVPNRTD